MAHVEPGDTVKVDYICMLNNSIVGTSIKKYAKEANILGKDSRYEPLCFKTNANAVIDGFEKAVLGMENGEEKTVAIAPHEAYGHYRDNLVRKYPRSLFEQQGVELEPSMALKINLPSGPLRATVIELDERDVTLDLNHEFAGKTLIFKIILKEITKNF